MQDHIRTLKLDETLYEVFLSFLRVSRYQVPEISSSQEKLISNISQLYLMSGFLLHSCEFDLSHESLVTKLKHQRKLQLMKQMTLKKDLQRVAHIFNENGIKHLVLKGLALISDGIYDSGMRASRDIDLLVAEDDLDEAYLLLKSAGFQYSNPDTQDSIKYRQSFHHFPEMTNCNNTRLELHWRVTSTRDFKACPLTDYMMRGRRMSYKDSKIYCPAIESNIAHILYHGLVQHRMNLGPVFLFDLASIFNFYKKWPVNKNLLEVLGINNQFECCKKVIGKFRYEARFSDGSQPAAKILQQSHWLQIAGDSDVSPWLTEDKIYFSKKKEKKKKPISKLFLRAKRISYAYQVSYFSPKFWLFFLNNIFTHFFNKISIRFHRIPKL